MAAQAPSFFQRWARRDGGPGAAPARGPGTEALPSPPLPLTEATEPTEPRQPARAAEPKAPLPVPTLADVAQLGPDADYARFVGRDVAPEVRNAALGRLFTDPRFNVMDGLDVYVDDYSQPDPLPPGMLRRMAQSQWLGLFDGEDGPDRAAPPGPAPQPQAEPALTAAAAAEPPPSPAPTTGAHIGSDTRSTTGPRDEDPDLQLQPDDGARGPGAAPGAGRPG